MRLFVISLALSFVIITGAVHGQEYPTKPIRIITGSAGGANDVAARLIAQGISGPLGQPVIVDNRSQGVLAAEAGAKAAPDGYNLLIAANSLWISPLMGKVPYDPKDFAPISLISRDVFVVVVHPSVPVKSIKELIALAKAHPGTLNFGSSGTGSGSHLAGELFKSMAGVDMVHIPYKGAGPAAIGLLGGQIHLVFASISSVAPNVKTGKLRALAVTSAEPSAVAPDLPTVAAAGVPGYESVLSVGILAPAKTPASIINRLNQEIVRVLNTPEVKAKFLSSGSEIIASSPERFATTIASESSRLAKVIKDAGIHE